MCVSHRIVVQFFLYMEDTRAYIMNRNFSIVDAIRTSAHKIHIDTRTRVNIHTHTQMHSRMAVTLNCSTIYVLVLRSTALAPCICVKW